MTTGAVAYCFAPRPIRIVERSGWSVTVIDDVTGDDVLLAPDREPRRRARPQGSAIGRKETFDEPGCYAPRADVVDGYAVETRHERDAITYRLTRIADGSTSELVMARSLGHIVTGDIAIRGTCVLCVADSSKRVEAFDVATGAARWTAKIANVVAVSFLGDAPVACDERGKLVVFDPARGTVVRTLSLGTQGTPSLHAGTSGVFVHHDRGLVFVDADGPRVLLDELVAEPGCAVAGDAWCRWDKQRQRVVVGAVDRAPRVIELARPAVELWMDPRGLAWSQRDVVGFAPLDALARDGEVRARCIPVVDDRPPRWEQASVFMASTSFAIIKDRWGRRTLGWKASGMAKNDTLEVADFVREYAGAQHADRVGDPTRLRRHGVETALDVGGAPLAPQPSTWILGSAGDFAARERAVPPVIQTLLDLGLVTRSAAIEQLIAAGVDNAAVALQHEHGARDGIANGVVSYDHRLLDDTDDPVADFMQIAAHPAVHARATSIGPSEVRFELTVDGTTREHRLELDEEFLETLQARFNAALAEVGASRRIFSIDTGADFYCFLACEPAVADALIRAGASLCDA